MNPWQQLLDVQALDTTLSQLEHRRSQLPERAELEEVDTKLMVVRADVADAEEEKHVLAKEQKRLEDEIALVQDKIAAAEKKLYSGGSSDAKELQALQDEIEGWKHRTSALEDEELEVMEQIEPIDERLGQLGGLRAELDEQAVGLTKVIAEAESEIEAEREQVERRRAEVVAGIAPDAVAQYEAVRGRLGGVAVARLEGGVCGACHMKLSAVEHDRIQHLAPDEEVRCEDCGRFLVRS